MSAPTPDTAAAVDLGSNSFHMIVAQINNGHIQVIDRMREMVRLAAGLDEKNRLSEAVTERAMECLRRFGQRLQGMPHRSVRAVGTNTLRKARNRSDFLARAEETLGHPIDVISGLEEARLIYLGVAHSLENDGKKRLVVDIGGGSTELIIGRKFETRRMESLHMGCVGMSQKFFADGIITTERMRAAEIAALQELEALSAPYREAGWESAVGSSGTILSIHEAVLQTGWSKEGITAASLRKLVKSVTAAGDVAKLDAYGISAERAPVLPGGLAILSATFEELGIEQMTVASGALREGLIYDLIGRIRHEDVRERTVEELGQRYRIEAAQARRVRRKALALHEQAAEAWQLGGEEQRQLLVWAASLHEIGLSISHSQYHKHGGYLLNNLDMPGFSRGEQQRLAFIVRAHRRKYPLPEEQTFEPRTAREQRRLAMLLRLAVVLHRSRTDAADPRTELEITEESIKLRFPEGWIESHPLTQADLEQEAGYLKAVGVKLKFK